jgi:hypothetical protein
MKKKESSEHAKALSSLGASKGGKARSANLTDEQKSEIASKAAKARWGDKLPTATHGDDEHPLRIGDTEIGCYVLDNGERVISQRALQGSIGMNASGGAQRLIRILATFSAKGIDTKDLSSRIRDPIKFKTPTGPIAHGYSANVLADICSVINTAARAGILQSQQKHIADQCQILWDGFAVVGLIALIDEATGYQYDRARTALAEILTAFLKGSLGEWAKRFDDDFYKELCRLRNIPWPPAKNLPSYIGHLTNDIVYDRLAPGLLEELQSRNPKTPRGHRKNKHHQWLTDDIGHPKLKEYLAAVKALMRSCDDWPDFHKRLDRAFPKFDLSALDIPDNVIMIEAEKKADET